MYLLGKATDFVILTVERYTLFSVTLILSILVFVWSQGTKCLPFWMKTNIWKKKKILLQNMFGRILFSLVDLLVLSTLTKRKIEWNYHLFTFYRRFLAPTTCKRILFTSHVDYSLSPAKVLRVFKKKQSYLFGGKRKTVRQ